MAEKGGDVPPPVLSADQAAFHHPPPSYEEVMGVFQTSVKQTTDLPQLAYIDIMPRCLKPGNIKAKIQPTFDNFSAIMEGANRWLVDNPGLAVWKCESVERLLSVDVNGGITYDLNAMIRHDATFGFSVYVKGIRLWLTQASPGTKPQQLGLKNVVPEKKTIEIPMHRRGYYRRGRIIVGGEVTAMLGGHFHSYTTFERLEDTINRLNKSLAEQPIPGTILTIETDTVKAFDNLKMNLDPEASCWSDNKEKFKRVTQVVRIFYVKGASANEQIGIQDFTPDVIQPPEMINPGKFEDFNNIITKVAHWVPANQGSRVVNIQQFDAVVHRDILENELAISSDSTDELITNFKERRMAKTLRVFHVTSSSQGAPLNANYISSRIFLPVRTGTRQFETMTQTMDRIDCWLRVTGANVYSVETLQLLFSESHKNGADINRADYTVRALSGKHWLTAIRVYFPEPYAEPDPALLPPQNLFSQSSSGSCSIL